MCDNPFSKLKLLHINGDIGEQGDAFYSIAARPFNTEILLLLGTITEGDWEK